MLVGVFAPAASSQASTPPTGSASASICNYFYEWVRAVRFPIQADPHAAYSYVGISSAAANAHVAFVVHGSFPYAAWTSWDVYGSDASPTAVANDDAIVPDSGSVNPYVVNTRLMARHREFTLLYLPTGVRQGEAAPGLQRIARQNVFHTPTDGGFWALANRVYQAFPGYNQGGSAGPTNTPFPTVSAVDYQTGKPVSCAPYNVIPPALQRSPNNPPHSASVGLPLASIKLTDGRTLTTADTTNTAASAGSASAAGSGNSSIKNAVGFEYAPPNPHGIIQFTRPPLAAGADVSSIPPPDNCSGYLGTATSTTRISLIRMPHVPTYLDIHTITPATTRPVTEASYVSFTQYGGSLGLYKPESPITISLGDAQLNMDRTGGSTVVVWPRILTPAERRRVFGYAQKQGWAIMRGGTRNLFTTPNLLIREKGSSGYDMGVGNVPCYYGTPKHPMHQGQRWSQVTGSKYVASPSNIKAGAPQGVTCTVAQFTDGTCLEVLKTHIKNTGGNYYAPGVKK